METVLGALHLLRPESSESQAFKAGCRSKQALHAACSDGDGADADQAGESMGLTRMCLQGLAWSSDSCTGIKGHISKDIASTGARQSSRDKLLVTPGSVRLVYRQELLERAWRSPGSRVQQTL